MTAAAPPIEPAERDRPLKGRVARGAAWVLGAGLFARALGALNTIIVARLLAPDDIGLVAVAVAAMQLLQGFSDIGVSQAVVKFRDASRDDLDTLFALSVLRGLAVGAALAAAAPFAAAFYGDARMFWAFLAIAAFPVAAGFINPKFYEFERDLNFTREFISTVLNKFAGVVVSIAVAVIFRTYWAILLGLLTGGIVQLILSYAMRPFRPRFRFKSFRKVFGLSGWLTGVSFMAALNNKLDAPVLARLVGAGGAGFYFMGSQLSALAAQQIAGPFGRAVYPGLSALQGDRDRMAAAFLRSVAALGAVALPAALGAALIAEDLVQFILGEQWLAVAPIIRILAPAIAVEALFLGVQGYAVALGAARLVFIRELIFFAVRFPIFLWATLSFGLAGAVWAAAGCSLLHAAFNLALYARAGGRAFWEPLAAARRSIAAAAGMAAYFLALRPMLTALETAPLLARLLADIGAGAAVYVLLHALLWTLAGRPDGPERDALRIVRRVVAGRDGRKAGAVRASL